MFSSCICSIAVYSQWLSSLVLPAAISGGGCGRRHYFPQPCNYLELYSLDGKKEKKDDGDCGSLPLGGCHGRWRCIPSEGEHPSFDGLSAVSSTMASAESGDRSNLTSSDSGQTARFGGGPPTGDDSFAMPVATGDAEVELPAIEDGDDSHVFEDSYMIAENVMASLT
jgi:hypothetical protein